MIIHKIKKWNILHNNFTDQIWIGVKKYYFVIAQLKLNYEKLSLFFTNLVYSNDKKS